MGKQAKIKSERRNKKSRLSEKEYIVVRMLQLYASASEGVKHNPKAVIGYAWISYEASIGKTIPSFTVQNIKLDWFTFYRDEFVSINNEPQN